MSDENRKPENRKPNDDTQPDPDQGGSNEPGQNGGGPPRGGRPPVRMSRGAFSTILVIGVLVVVLILLNRSINAAHTTNWTNFKTEVVNGNIEKILVYERRLTGEYRKPPPDAEGRKNFELDYPGHRSPSDFDGVIAGLVDEGQRKTAFKPPTIEFNTKANYLLLTLITWLPILLILGIIWFFLIRQMRQSGGGAGMLGNFGRSRHRMMTREHINVTFADVAGIEEPKEEVYEIVEFLKNPKRFQRLGGRIPRGVLLVGSPGCGKTMLAKAIAGEADVPFFSISGSDFVEMFVGVGASRVRDLFRQAKENSPCIVFLDEIDAVGRRRGVGFNGGGHDEREQTLNAILVEMDGFDSNDQVIVVAATNRADVLDPALTRPGRFDRQVIVPLPDVRGRFEILRVHAKKVKITAPIDPKLNRIARGTPMFSGADLAALINESALLATLAGKDAIELDDLEEARDKVRFGRAKRSRVIDEDERKLTAYHEAGHAVVQSLLPAADPVHKVSIIPRGPYGGATFALPEKDRYTFNRSWLEAQMRVACAGRIAESLLSLDENSGVSGDIRQITELAKRMITEWGMSDKLGFVFLGEDDQKQGFDMGQKDFSERTAEVIDTEIKRVIDEAYADAKRIIEAHREDVAAVAEALLKYETIDGDEVRRIIAGEHLDRPTVADLIEAEQRRREQSPPSSASSDSSSPEDDAGPLPSPA